MKLKTWSKNKAGKKEVLVSEGFDMGYVTASYAILLMYH